MDTARIARLLQPYLPGPLSAAQLQHVSAYLDLLVRWNSKINLTAVRSPEEMVQRHFGESFFAAAQLIAQETPQTAIDVGSGAGFPGLPLAIYSPVVSVTLIESQNKKATFLKEVVRALALKNVTVFDQRAESFPGKAELVLMRAVEKFALSAGQASRLITPGGSLALLIGKTQAGEAMKILPQLHWQQSIPLPESESRILLVGKTANR